MQLSGLLATVLHTIAVIQPLTEYITEYIGMATGINISNFRLRVNLITHIPIDLKRSSTLS